MVNRKQAVRARRMIRSRGYWNMRLMQLRLLLNDTSISYNTHLAEVGGAANMEEPIHSMYMKELVRLRRKAQWYLRKLDEEHMRTGV